jgi:hypothetical protein
MDPGCPGGTIQKMKDERIPSPWMGEGRGDGDYEKTTPSYHRLPPGAGKYSLPFLWIDQARRRQEINHEDSRKSPTGRIFARESGGYFFS